MLVVQSLKIYHILEKIESLISKVIDSDNLFGNEGKRCKKKSQQCFTKRF